MAGGGVGGFAGWPRAGASRISVADVTSRRAIANRDPMFQTLPRALANRKQDPSAGENLPNCRKGELLATPAERIPVRMSQHVYTLDQFNHLPDADARAALTGCCKSARWVEQVLARRMFAQFDDLLIAADEAFAVLEPADWREAFARPEPLEDKEL